MSSGQEDLRFYLEEAGLSPAWVIFFEAVAANESHFNNLVGLGKPSFFPSWAKPNTKASQAAQQREHEAAVTAYERNRKKYENCGHAEHEYTFGSGGWFGIIPANGLGAFKNTKYSCLNPGYVFSEAGSVVMAIEMARRLMRWDSWKATPSFANLRVGWGNPSKMNDSDKLSEVEGELAERYFEIGADPADVYTTPPPLPAQDPVGMFDHLTAL